MTVVKVPLAQYTISLPYLIQLAGEFEGKVLSATVEDDDAEFGWEGPSAPSQSKAFRAAIDTSFKKRDPNAQPEGGGI